MRTVSKDQGLTLTGRHVLFALLAFFGVVFAVNGYFLKAALSTYTGVVAVEPYRKGLKYNERIEAAERQEALGWHEEISIAQSDKRLAVALRDREGNPVRGLHLTVSVGRAVTARDDVSLPLTEVEPGRYEGMLAVAEPGGYVATIEARQRDDQDDADVVYRARKRLWLKH